MSYQDDEQDLLQDPDKGVREARGVLAVLWRQLLVVLDVDIWRWSKLMHGYLTDPRNGIPNNSRNQATERGNLNKALRKDDLTWRVFLRGLNFLNLMRVRFSVEITLHNGRTYTVSAKLKDRHVPMPTGRNPSHPEDTGSQGELFGSSEDPNLKSEAERLESPDPDETIDELSSTEQHKRGS